MASVASLAQEVSNRSNEEIIEALSLVLALRPELTQLISELLLQEPAERFSGVLAAFYPQKQYGFIKSDAVQALYGVDTWVSESELGPFKQGDELTFSIVMNKKNQPQARLVAGADGSKPKTASAKRTLMSPGQFSQLEKPAKAARVVSAPALAAQAPMVVPARQAVQPMQPMQQWGQQMAADPWGMDGMMMMGGGDPSQGRYVGNITCFYPAKHYGFINAPDVAAQFGVDTFVSDKEIGEFGVGSTVEFDLCVNAKGSPQARNLSVPSGGAGAFSAPSPMPMGKGKAAAPMGKGIAPKGGKGVVETMPGRYTGVISCFYPDKKFGFVKCDAVMQQYGVDTFLSDKEIGEFQIGSEISFEMAINAKWQPQARNIGPAGAGKLMKPTVPAQTATLDVPANAGAAAQQHAEDQVFVGIISAFMGKFGFIKCDEVHAIYGVDTFISDKEIGEFGIGDQIGFKVALNRNGKPQAREVHQPEFVADGTEEAVEEGAEFITE